MNKKKSYVFVGASQRALLMFMQPMKEKYANYCEMKGVYDINPGRAKTVADKVGMPVYDDFEKMIAQTKPDVVFITTVDAFHSDYIIRSMELGCDVVTEKPMTIDAPRCRAILEAERRTGRKTIVTFNYRYAPFMTKIKELLISNAIGNVFSIHFEWLLDRNMDIYAHGSSYFRRWNSRMKNSGGLLVHKSTHHFDLVNWWISQKPEQVSAFGKLNLYGTSGSQKYANGIRGENCRKCTHAKECGFYYEMTDFEKEIYEANEKYDGYFKDGCVYASDIDIYDTMAVNVKYDGGALLTYSLNATCSYEGWRIAFNGSEGRLEAYLPETGPDEPAPQQIIRVFDLNNNVTEHKMSKVTEGHGGGDERLRETLFKGCVSDPLGHCAGTRDGALSIIIGAAANLSISEGKIIHIQDLLNLE